jgi:hypothetical protein
MRRSQLAWNWPGVSNLKQSMITPIRKTLCAVLLLAGASAGPARAESAGAATSLGTPRPGLTAFADEEAFQRQVDRWRKQIEREQRATRSSYGQVVAEASPAAAPAEMASAPAADSITNVQTAGVDEGGIVKRHGDHLVILRRGRLFTVAIGDDRLQPVAAIEAFAPTVVPFGDWYDEMLVSGNTVVVIGYSYARGGSELVLFDIDAAGRLAYRDTYHLRSNDYYSANNYASRLIGTTLVLYTPFALDLYSAGDLSMPALRRWRPQATPADFRRILPATRIYRTDAELDSHPGSLALHTVTRCDLAARELECSATAVLGPSGRVFYVSTDAVYVWTVGSSGKGADGSSLFRIPLDAETPRALKTRGAPLDQMSFLQDADGFLNVLLSQVGAGEGMWGTSASAGDLALLRVPLADFGDGTQAAPAGAYRRLPGQAQGSMANRYVGRWLLYGTAPWSWSRSAGNPSGSTAFALRYGTRDDVQPLALGHGAERIEALGNDALIVGSARDDLHFTSVRLGDDAARVAAVHVQAQARQGESRSHGFFYRATTVDEGLVGLPVLGQRPIDARAGALVDSAGIVFLRNRGRVLSPLGELVAEADASRDDGCRASCVDWYGNARPIFIGDRLFALMGYELVEGRANADRIVERRRTRFAPDVTIAR